jgi:SAM-dependent methyltransferase
MAVKWTAKRLESESNYWRSAILLTAAHLDLFAWLGKRKIKSAAAAVYFGGDEDSWESFLDALSGMCLIRKQATRYSSSAFAARYLTGDKRTLLLPQYDAWCTWGDLTSILTTAKRTRTQKPFASDRAQSARLLQGLDLHAEQIAPYVIQGLRLGGAKTLLDIGGGLGTFARAFCRRYSRLQVTLLEHPNIAPLARRAVEDSGLAQRIRVVGRNFTRGSLPVGFDAVFASNILHAHGAAENLFLLRQIHRSLNPSGQLIVRDVFMRQDRLAPEWGALFSIALLLHTPRGRCYSLGEIRKWLRQAGFATIQGPRQSSPLAFDPDAILIATKSS